MACGGALSHGWETLGVRFGPALADEDGGPGGRGEGGGERSLRLIVRGGCLAAGGGAGRGVGGGVTFSSTRYLVVQRALVSDIL